MNLTAQFKDKISTMSSPELNSSKKTVIARINFAITMIAEFLYLLYCLATFVVCLVVTPFLAVFVGFLKLFRSVLDVYIRWTRKCLLLREDDAVWLQDRPTNRHVIHAFMLIEGSPNVEKLRELVAERLVWAKDENGKRICARLSQVISTHLGNFIWEEDKHFDIKNHVTCWRGCSPKTKEELEQVMSEIMSSPLEMTNISPWQFVVVPTSLEGNKFAFLLRIHHTMADGVALTRLFVMNLYDNPPRGREPKKFTTKQRFFMWCKAAIVGPLMIIEKLLASRDNSLLHGQELSGKKVVSWSKDFSLALVKRLKNETGTTVNDIMVSCVAGGFHDYLQKSGIRNPNDMWASVPVDIRASSKSLKFKNKFALVFLRLPIAAKECMERLFITKHRMDIIKTSAEPLVTGTTVKFLMLLPSFISRFLIDYFAYKMTCVLSNVPGPQESLYLGGQKIVGGIFWPPQRANIGIGLSIFSYAGKIRVGVCGDSNVLPNPHTMVKGIEKSFDSLVDSLNMNENN